MEERKRRMEKLQRLVAEFQNKRPEDFILHHKGYQYPVALCKLENLQAIEIFEARREDVMLVAYPKCGFNWAIQLLQNITSAAHPENEGKPALAVPMLEFTSPDKVQEMKSFPSPRVFGTHLHYDEIPASFFKNRTKMVVVFRNPKDTAVSYFHFCNGNPLLPTCISWDEFFNKFIAGDVFWGSYFSHAIAWNEHIDDEDVLLLTFEELKEDLKGGIKKIADFYGFSLSEEQIQSVADRGTFKSMKETSKKTHFNLSDVFFRKGEIGDWKNHFTDLQNKEMDKKFEECLAGTKLGAKLKYNLYCKA
ncbi:sulfotransferase 6B1-like isoform X2 [Protopterus annectens]|uniref:sulfotransferase 6B1-like isoform X2 n=1 Tax=Protopterus annectens TaxID=7888 RepID=UPI001CFA4319|nr:sulfotransferase 6B1-like isoform X2 [Protopterus annectens]